MSGANGIRLIVPDQGLQGVTSINITVEVINQAANIEQHEMEATPCFGPGRGNPCPLGQVPAGDGAGMRSDMGRGPSERELKVAAQAA